VRIAAAFEALLTDMCVISIGIGVSHTGNASYSMGLAMFQNRKCAGVSDAVLVYTTEQGPAPMPEHMREVLATKMLPRNVRS
jgi:acyl-CoA thioesterase FadM